MREMIVIPIYHKRLLREIKKDILILYYLKIQRQKQK